MGKSLADEFLHPLLKLQRAAVSIVWQVPQAHASTQPQPNCPPCIILTEVRLPFFVRFVTFFMLGLKPGYTIIFARLRSVLRRVLPFYRSIPCSGLA